MTTRRHLLWALPLFVILALFVVILALPRFVASDAHRATIEAFASSLTGRRVKIGGDLSLVVLPAPRIIAGNVTIGGPAGQAVAARSLTLDIALAPLLRGRLAARNITLQSPTITLPWPLPGGPASARPPPWLAALHAVISDGTITLGRLRFAAVNADIFTGGNGALSVSGTATAGATPLTLSLALSAPDAAGHAALAIDSRTPDGKRGGHFSGTLDSAGEIRGALTASFIPPGGTLTVSGTAAITANATTLTASDIRLAQGAGTLTGDAGFDLEKPAFVAVLAGNDLDVAALAPLLTSGMAGVPGTLDLSVTGARLPAGVLPQLRADLAFGAQGVTLRQVTATMPGEGSLTLTGGIDRAGRLAATAALASADLPGLLAGFDIAAPPAAAWQTVRLSAALAADAGGLSLTDIKGSLGQSHVFGSLVIRRPGLAVGGDLAFDQLDLAPVIALLRQTRPGRFSLAGELTADRAFYGGLTLNRVLLDVSLNRRLIVRRLSASLYGGIALTDFSLSPSGQLTAGRAMLAVPSAAPLLALAGASDPIGQALPPLLSHAPLAGYVAAAGGAADLAASAVATLGAYSVTAAPVINLIAGTAAGPLTLRHPDAIAAAAPFYPAAGLAWPGAGSISLRADMAVSSSQFALPNFLLTFGDTTAAGSFAVTSAHRLTADIAAGTLALPPLGSGNAIPWKLLMSATGKVTLSADQVWLGGDPILGPGTASLAFTPNTASLALTEAKVGNGAITGTLAATMAGATPSLSLKLNLADVAAASLALPVAFPFTLPAGTLSGQAALQATGHAPAAWAATLSGTASLSAANGVLNGFDLAALGRALGTKTRAGWKKAATAGATPYASLALAGTIDDGTLTLQSASLASPDGSATATGNIDLPDRALDLTLALTPATTPPTTINVTTIGGWATPKQVVPKTP